MAHKILVVDDDAGFTKLLRMNLEKSGEYEIQVVNNSLTALSTARSFQPEVVLLDIVMPGLDGGDIVTQFKNDAGLSEVPIIMLTALVSDGETSHGSVAQTGTMCVLPKPVNMAHLKERLQEALGKD